jgi:2-polyprenyl-6-hydroxyphenyl methylase/3-demethylubiquinone-9 3-methyltransferase
MSNAPCLADILTALGVLVNKPTTIDPAEQARFERLAKLWWDKSGPFWPLHGMNELRAGYIRDQISHWRENQADADRQLNGLRILDIGCGGGILSEAIARMGAEVHGVDMVEKNIKIARSHAAEQGLKLEYECCTAEALAKRGEVYDAILNMEVVEHVADLPLFMRSCARLLKPGGIMMVATINRTLASFLSAIVGAEYVLRWLPRGTHQWRKFPTPAELEDLLRADGLIVVDRTGVRLNPLNRNFWLVPYLGINYMLVAVKPA